MIEIYTLLVSSEKGNTKWENSKYDIILFLFSAHSLPYIFIHTLSFTEHIYVLKKLDQA